MNKKNHNPGIAKAVYAGICSRGNYFYASVYDRKKTTGHKIKKGLFPEKSVLNWLRDYAEKNNSKFIAVGFDGAGYKGLISKLWLKEDIVPFFYGDSEEGEPGEKARKICQQVSNEFDKNNLVKIKMINGKRVCAPDLVDLHDYKKTARPEDFTLLLKLAREFKDKKIKAAFFNSTAAGGGVAIMRHALIRLCKLLDIDIKWYVLHAKQEIYNITKKKFHNILQAVAMPDLVLTKKDKELFNEWSARNAQKFEKIIKELDVAVIDDPQPSGLIPYIKKLNPQVKILYRSHIQIVSELINNCTPQQCQTWNFLWNNIRHADCFVSHAVKEFIPNAVPAEKTVMMPATTDPLDGLNKKLSREQMNYYFSLFNEMLVKMNQKPLDMKRPYIIQIARFDPSKGIPHVIEAYKKLRRKMDKEKMPKSKIPQLVIIGNGAIDDPEGAPIFMETMQMIAMDSYKHLSDDIKAARLPHYDQILNTLLSGSKVALQLSLKEGCEVKVSESLAKGKPVIAYNTGGIPQQIINKVTGFLVRPGHTGEVAKILYELSVNDKKYKEISKNAETKRNYDYFTVNNVNKWLFLINEIYDKGKITGNKRLVSDLMAKK